MDIVPSKFVRFDSDGLELVVNTDTGLAYASISATARMLETDESNLRKHINKEGVRYGVVKADIDTGYGIKEGVLVPAVVLLKLAFKYHPQLALKMGEAGSNLYLFKLAGYKATIEPELSLDDKMVLMAEGFLKERKEKLALAAKIEADAPNTLLGETISKASNNIRIGEFAKSLVDANGKPMGQNKYFEELRECKIIMQTSTLPYQQFINSGYFVVTQVVQYNQTYPVSLITGKGQKYLAKRHQQHLDSIASESTMEMQLSALV